MAEWLLVLRGLLVFWLYAFLALVIYILWRGLTQAPTQAPAPPRPAWIVVEAGEEAGQKRSLEPITAMGRAPDNTLVMHDAFASAHHLLLIWREGQWWIEDLDSHNGTYLNGERLRRPMPLAAGDEIRVGETKLRFECSAPTTTTETLAPPA